MSRHHTLHIIGLTETLVINYRRLTWLSVCRIFSANQMPLDFTDILLDELLSIAKDATFTLRQFVIALSRR